MDIPIQCNLQGIKICWFVDRLKCAMCTHCLTKHFKFINSDSSYFYINMSAAMTGRQSHWLACSSPRFDLQKGRNLLFLSRTGIGAMMERNLNQSLVTVPNIPGLNLNYLCSAYYVKAYILLITIHPSDGYLKPGCFLGH